MNDRTTDSLSPIPDEVREFLSACGVSPAVLASPDMMLRLYEDLSVAAGRMNLTRIDSPADFWLLHVADSLAIARVRPDILRDSLHLADVGTGAGFPLFPLLWANPRLRTTAVETRKRRIQFLQEEVIRLGLSARVTILHRQAREAGRLPGCQATCDVVTARAVGSAGRLIRDCRQMLRPGGGMLVLYKTPASIREEREEARREARKYGLRLRLTPPFDLPGKAGTRAFLLVERP